MVFHSSQFLFFFLGVFLVYFFLDTRRQNIWLLAASYAFCCFWSWKFLAVLTALTAFTYLAGRKIEAGNTKMWPFLGAAVPLLTLAFFKYANFFLDSFTRLTGGEPSVTLKILLPAGISFYTFKAISYCVDISRGQLKSARSFTDLALYLAFFPQMIAGPIDRAVDLLPQIQTPRVIDFEKVKQGGFCVLWGLFLKIFAADNLAAITDPVFASAGPYPAGLVLVTSYQYAWQLYCDFAGYSMMAWGLAKFLGFETAQNFDLPLWSTNIQMFWNRWHISLSRWIRDYVYTPVFLTVRTLSSAGRLYTATLFSMFCMGLWHGAGWHYVMFGMYHGILLCLYIAARPALQKIRFKNPFAESAWFWMRVAVMFHLAAIGFLIFRVQSCAQFFQMMDGLFSFSGEWDVFFGMRSLLFYVAPVFFVELFQLSRKDRFAVWNWPFLIRTAFYILCFFLFSVYGAGGGHDYIYFQF